MSLGLTRGLNHYRSAFAAVLLAVTLCGAASASGKADKTRKKSPEPSALDKYIQEALSHGTPAVDAPAAGSIWSPASRLTDLGADLRAAQVDDLVTIVVNEQASSVVSGDVNTQRQSSVAASITQLFGVKSTTGALANLAGSSNNTQLKGTGETSRTTQVSATLSARVTHVLPNGYLVLEGTKLVQVNGDHQAVKVRGIIRTIDLSPGNVITSNQLAQLEVSVDGKGVINDAIRRPNFLYRLFLGLLPF
jgi:flagellar L-ring protein precursor FlgH